MIIYIPPVSQRKSAVDAKEKVRVMEWLGTYIIADQPQPTDLIDQITQKVMLDRFGWGSTVGKMRTLATLQALEKDGKIQIRTDAIEIIPPPPEVIIPPKPKRAMPVIKPIKRGPAHCRTKGEKLGEENEARVHEILIRLVNSLIALIPSVLEGTVERSGRHRPDKGKIDVRDHQGSDAELKLTIRDIFGKLQKLWLIYDVKSSEEKVKKFNKNIRIFSSQKTADLKRAILGNKTRTDRSIAQEVLGDLVTVGLMSEYQIILDRFDD